MLVRRPAVRRFIAFRRLLTLHVQHRPPGDGSVDAVVRRALVLSAVLQGRPRDPYGAVVKDDDSAPAGHWRPLEGPGHARSRIAQGLAVQVSVVTWLHTHVGRGLQNAQRH